VNLNASEIISKGEEIYQEVLTSRINDITKKIENENEV